MLKKALERAGYAVDEALYFGTTAIQKAARSALPDGDNGFEDAGSVWPGRTARIKASGRDDTSAQMLSDRLWVGRRSGNGDEGRGF